MNFLTGKRYFLYFYRFFPRIGFCVNKNLKNSSSEKWNFFLGYFEIRLSVPILAIQTGSAKRAKVRPKVQTHVAWASCQQLGGILSFSYLTVLIFTKLLALE
jgi:hypothetical protein